MAAMGRPRKPIKIEQFESLCAIQCSKEEICAVLGVSDKTLDKWVKEVYGEETSFSEVFRQKRAGGKASLRRTQWRHAEKNIVMSIFLGKQYLGQADLAKVEQKTEITLNYNLEDSEGDKDG